MKTLRYPLILLAALALASALAATGCGGAKHETAAHDAGPAVDVTVLRAAASSGDALVLPARVTAREEVTLTARLAARLTALPLREGDHFRRGQTLATFDAPETRAQLDGARAGLAAATVARDMARKQEARMDSLYANRVAALRELEGAQAERRGAEAAWAQAKAQVDGMQSGATLEAPFDGVVVRRHADVGVTVGPGMPLMDIRSSDVGEITVSVPESELGRLGASGATEYQVGDGAWAAATLVRTDGMTDYSTRSRVARFKPASGARLEAGAFARVRLAGASGAAGATVPVTLNVPVSALVTRGGLTGVYVAEDGVARLRWLRVGRANGGNVTVLAGLAAEDEVIVNPAGLADGRAVKVAS
ncbi:MAG: efflux RND transporter periplasmic adaptor subunit [Candidatus Eisenbacteria bacterium]|nr:efflux RND transporter periplasmic adaptor subunit [Candidatus Eisenbacteria bacterium]